LSGYVCLIGKKVDMFQSGGGKRNSDETKRAILKLIQLPVSLSDSDQGLSAMRKRKNPQQTKRLAAGIQKPTVREKARWKKQ
jgi:hypothetical protein